MTVRITATYAGVLGLFLLALSYRVARRRMKFRVGIGAGANSELERAIRVHGNFTEYVPFALLLMALFESGGGPAWAVHGAGIILLVARALHAAGLTTSSGRTPGRFIGTLSTWFVIAALSIGNLVKVSL